MRHIVFLVLILDISVTRPVGAETLSDYLESQKGVDSKQLRSFFEFTEKNADVSIKKKKIAPWKGEDVVDVDFDRGGIKFSRQGIVRTFHDQSAARVREGGPACPTLSEDKLLETANSIARLLGRGGDCVWVVRATATQCIFSQKVLLDNAEGFSGLRIHLDTCSGKITDLVNTEFVVPTKKSIHITDAEAVKKAEVVIQEDACHLEAIKACEYTFYLSPIDGNGGSRERKRTLVFAYMIDVIVTTEKGASETRRYSVNDQNGMVERRL
jgi:hypothetical protein